jgi:hypothetical protein
VNAGGQSALPNRSSSLYFSGLIAKGREVGHHILHLLGVENRAIPQGGSDPLEAVSPMVGRHDRLRIDATTVDNPRPQLRGRQSAARSCQIGGEITLLTLLGKWAAVAKQAQAAGAVGHNRTPSCRITLKALKRVIDAIGAG